MVCKEDKTIILRLLIIMSCLNDGTVKKEHFDGLIQTFVASYGSAEIQLLMNL